MATATLPPLLATPAAATAATLPNPPIEIQHMASVNLAAGSQAAPPSRLQAPVTGAPSLAAAGPPHSWSLPAMDARPGAALPREAGPSLTAGATPAQEVAPSSAGPAASVTASANPSLFNWLLPAPGNSPGMNPLGTRSMPARPAGTWSLPSKILKVSELQPQDGCIWRLDGASLPPGACTPMVVFLGPLFPMMDQRQGMEETKWKYVHNLIHRAHPKKDVEQKLSEYITHVNAMEGRIRQRYDPNECRITREELVEMMVLDGLFIIEVLINHWVGKIEKGSASPQATADTAPDSDFTAPLASTMVPQALREEFTPLKVRWEPYALRFDLIAVPNQIPFFVLEELFQMTDIPELRESEKQLTKLREIILDYLVGDVAGHVLAGYQGPVYHILHLVYLHLTFSKEETRVSALQPKAPVTRSTSLDTALGKLKQKSMDLRALYRRTFSRSSSLPVGWRQWRVIPPLRELVRVGVKLKRVETPRFTDVKFKNGVLEIPAFAWRRYHIRLLTNLVVLEMSGWWPPEKRLFCSYVRFMSELIMKKEDAALLFKKGIVEENSADDVQKSLICPILILADFSHGSKYECHFDGLVQDMVKCYERWSKVGAVPRTTQ